MKTFFISDLHLQATHPKATTCFLNFINTQASACDALYILGDLFEYWVGDDAQDHLAEQVAKALDALKKSGVPIYFMAGNRDFLLGQCYAKQAGITLLPDPSIIDLYGKKVLITHGDLLCTDDVKYQRFRTKVRNPNWKKRFLNLPLWLRRSLAAIARFGSKRHTKKTELTLQDVNQQTVTDWFQKYDIEAVIHGHTHRSAIHEVNVLNLPRQRIVLGDWHKAGSVLTVNHEHHYQLDTIPF